MNRAALDRHAVPDGGDRFVETRRAIDDEELRLPQPAFDEIVEHRPPSLGALAAHASDRQQHLLAVSAHANDDEERDGGGFSVKPDTPHSAIEDQAYDRLL